MKKLIPILFMAFIFASCEKEPNLSHLDASYIVATDFDKKADFSSFGTYYLPDSILLINKSDKAEYLTDSQSDEILGAFESNMNLRGYSRTMDKTDATLGIQVSYIEDVNYFINYPRTNWWWNYPGYWDPWYWGSWGDWYYPYSVVYSYSVGSLLVEMVDLGAPTGTDKKLPIVWDSFMSGLLSSSNRFNLDLTVQAVNQAFTQSPYLKK